MTRTAIIVTLAAFCAPSTFAEVTLVRDGTPVAQIVLPADAAPEVALAAEELNLHLELMSGGNAARGHPARRGHTLGVPRYAG